MNPSPDNLLQQLQRDFVADSPVQRQAFLQRASASYQSRVKQRFWVLTICTLIAIFALLISFPFSAMFDLAHAITSKEFSISTIVLVSLPALVCAYVLVLIEGTR
ncbi:hypothetical protein [Thalassotalea sp. PS06]|uniref:hypothetical protein n=1 Tax=Thalassotalea sp. PS06 TaxID=2594005 RepID=UPI0011651E24|nr:hypothetical protein [Thalassotalea sp. PS06]QDP00456.1 hypothetical protein FNC98_03265 [Thalassotalea sp. PS06]